MTKKKKIKKKSILNLCGGKIIPEFEKNVEYSFLINLDQIYFTKNTIEVIRTEHINFNLDDVEPEYTEYSLCLNHDVYDFLERYEIPFDKVIIYRFLEHVPKSNVLYFIYLLSTITKPGAILDIIVPDYKILAQRILDENPYDFGFEAEDIITTYELLNDSQSPHLSVWTKERLVYFFSLEGRFRVKTMEENYKFDGRDLYLRAVIERI